ncbi:hypothetical protein KQX54_001227 [Cotesia glomerata]|uniref:Uncharacterized protein n=1 Tax=Cotesia glomerata TaxID=32391 RepID=A0AAV7J0X8_COTGL|nr:hypothetical protein KQX54_001227 [Cotesia glomerata]
MHLKIFMMGFHTKKSKSKPKGMNGYLSPFVAEAKKLYSDGFIYERNGTIFKKRVMILMGICDSVARPMVKCSTQFNGKYGCGLCLNEGKSIEKRKGHVRIYKIINDLLVKV